MCTTEQAQAITELRRQVQALETELHNWLPRSLISRIEAVANAAERVNKECG